MSHDYWVLHSPYPDKTWRGIEKCISGSEAGGPLLFDSLIAASEFLYNKLDLYFIATKVSLITPDVRHDLNT